MLTGGRVRNYQSRKRVRVTGSAGFLGSYLTDRLLDQGHEVACVFGAPSSDERLSNA